MAVTREKNRRTGKDEIFVEGEVTGVFFNELKTKKTYTGARGNSWTPTHAVNVIIDGKERVGLGLTDREPPLRCKDAEGNYVDVVRGARVSIEISEESEYNGVPQYSAVPANVLVLEQAKEQPQQQSSGSAGGYTGKRDNTGMEVGHAINAALCLLGYKPKSMEEVVDFSKQLHDITVSLKEQYKEQNPNMSDYDIGASVGHAVLNACRLLTKTKINDVYSVALEILNDVVPDVVAYVKGGSVKKEAPKTENKNHREEADVEDTTPDYYDPPVVDSNDYYDDDIPF